MITPGNIKGLKGLRHTVVGNFITYQLVMELNKISP